MPTSITPTLAALQASGKVDEHGQLRKDAFSGDETLTKVALPDGVTSIESGGRYGGGAFFGCSSLQEIVLPDTLSAIGHFAFRGCSSLHVIALPATLAAIGDACRMQQLGGDCIARHVVCHR